MITKQFSFMSGLPRSGSTLLCNILNQNEQIFATHTSPLLDLLYLNEVEWRNTPSVIASGHDQDQLIRLSRAIINGCWEHIDRPYICDKHRANIRNIPVLEHIMGQKPKIIATVRDIPSIIASFFTLLRNTTASPNYIDSMLTERGMFRTDPNRAEILWNEFIFNTWESLKIGFGYDKSCILLVEYDDLVSDPGTQMDRIYDFLEMDHYAHDFNNIQNHSKDDDLTAWGIENLHTIRPVLQKISNPAIDILGDAIYNRYKNMNLEFWRTQ